MIAHIIKLVIFLLFVIISLIGILYYFNKRQYSGIVLHHRDFGNITIYRDEYGVPHIKAANPVEAAYGLGYAQAQDRLFQLHLNRMISQGRLSEMVGNATLQTDIFLRTVGLARAGLENKKYVSKDLEQSLQAYADGINDYVNSLTMLPIEFVILQIPFQPWTVSDSFCFMMLLSLRLSSDFQIEGIRSKLEEVYGRDMAELMFVNRGEALIDDTVIINDEELKQMGLYEQFNRTQQIQKGGNQDPELRKRKEQADKEFEIIQKYSLPDYLHQIFQSLSGASNGWAISGKYTNTGKPIIANDPHLDIKMPSMWYLMETLFKNPLLPPDSEDWSVSGASMMGTPFLFSGRTNYAAYGVTAMLADSTDLVQEEIKDNSYFYQGKYIPMKFIDERILVKGQQDVIKRIRFTHRGPVFEAGTMPYYDGSRPVSFLWSSLVNNCTNLEGIQSLSLATNFDQFTSKLSLVTAPTLSNVFATVDGHIGYYGTGRIPIRSDLHNAGFISSGNDSSSDWIGFVPPQYQPRLTDPAKGYVIVANNKFATDNIKYHTSINLPTTSRGRRIKQMIQSFIDKGIKITTADVQAMQSDVLDSFVEQELATMIALFEKEAANYIPSYATNDPTNILRRMIAYMKTWDFRMDTESIAATIYKVWEHYLSNSFFQEVYPDKQTRLQVTVSKQGFFFDHFFFKEFRRWLKNEGDLNAKWCLNEQSRKLGKGKACIYNFVIALEQAREYLVERLGPDMEKWRYGSIHHHIYLQTPFSQTPLKFFFERYHESSGSRRTVQDAFSNEPGGTFDAFEGANLKIICSLDDEDESYQIIDSGQSENIFSPHYDDLQQLSKQGKYIPMRRGSKHFSSYQEVLVLMNKKVYNDLKQSDSSKSKGKKGSAEEL